MPLSFIAKFMVRTALFFLDLISLLKALNFSQSAFAKKVSELISTSSELIQTGSELIQTGSELISTGSELISTISE